MISFKIKKYKLPHINYFKDPPEYVRDFVPFNIEESRAITGYKKGVKKPISWMILQYMKYGETPLLKKLGLKSDIIKFEAIEVEEKYQNTGVGTKMLTYAIEYSRKNTNAKRLLVLANADNIPAVKLYSKLFNTPLTTRMKKYIEDYNVKLKNKEYEKLIVILKNSPKKAAEIITECPYLYKKDENLMQLFHLKLKK